MSKIRLVLADVDGTLVTREKVLTARSVAAVKKLRAAGIAFAITSGRPPRGMEMLVEPLALDTPIAAFNGGVFLTPKLQVIQQRVLGYNVAEQVIATIEEFGLDVWIYRRNDWYVLDRHGPHVDREEHTVEFPPIVVTSFNDYLEDLAKIVGVSDDLDAVARCEKFLEEKFSGKLRCAHTNPQRVPQSDVSAARSQPYYLDVTHPEANKGGVVDELSTLLSIPSTGFACIGDMPNDIAMFRRSGISIAMGQASAEVKQAATYVTDSSEEEGFAKGVERFVLNLTDSEIVEVP
ncbi:MAG: HAD family hydrolase [Verrucomicrobiaceae bacterium]|nr:MAG: HAD family hydrolase [Verrucomicrobiaceae bacterium]